MKLFKLNRLLGLAAFLVAGCAAYYSVYGLSQLFAGASTAVIIMASCLEFSKVISVSFLQRYRNKISKTLRWYLTTGVIVLVLITSAGIYGFLSNAYQKTAHKLELFEGSISILSIKKDGFDQMIGENKRSIELKVKRLQTLSDLRTNQENRMDAAINTSAKQRVRNDINEASKEIQKLNLEIESLNKRGGLLLDSSNYYSNSILETKSSSKTAGEVGPLKYLANLTNQPMDKVVNIFILLLIFVFDPLAVALVIATNKLIEMESENLVPNIVEPKEKTIEVVESDTDIDENEETTDTQLNEELVTTNDNPIVDPNLDESEVIIHNEETSKSIESTINSEQLNPETRKITIDDLKPKLKKRGFSIDIPQNNARK